MTQQPTAGVSRRRALAGLAAGVTTALAGCSELLGDDTGSTRFPAADVGPILSAPAPDLEWPTPVEPGADARQAATDRIDDLLGEVPETLEPEDVPNGVVRKAIQDARDEAATTRETVTDATGDGAYHALRESRGGRESARKAVTALLAIDADADEHVTELEDEHDAVRRTVDEQLADVTYRGPGTHDGRLRAALYAQQCEADLTRVERTLERWGTASELDVLEIGDDAAALEFATATASVWDHLEAEYEASLEDAVSLESTFADALERSAERATAIDLPDQDYDDWFEAIGFGDIDDTQLELFLWNAGRPIDRARDGIDDALREGHLGTGLFRALELEQATRAFDVVRDRVEDGWHVSPESIEAVRAEREAAIDAAAAAREEIPLSEPSLGASRLAETLQSFGWVDSSIERSADNDPDVTVSLSDEYGDYARIRAELEVLPAAVDAFRERLLAE